MTRLRLAAAATYALLILAGVTVNATDYGTTRDLGNALWSAPCIVAGGAGLVAVVKGWWWLERSALLIAAVAVACRTAMLALMAFTQPGETFARCCILTIVLVHLWTRHLRVSGPYLDPDRPLRTTAAAGSGRPRDPRSE